MQTDDLKKAILELSDEDKAGLIKEVMPELCRAVMADQNFVEIMMPACRQMMKNSPLQERMRSMMCGEKQQTQADNAKLDRRTKELVGIAAAIAGHCQPCFAYHFKEAVELGNPQEVIHEVVKFAKQIRASGDRHTDEFAARRMERYEKVD